MVDWEFVNSICNINSNYDNDIDIDIYNNIGGENDDVEKEKELEQKPT